MFELKNKEDTQKKNIEKNNRIINLTNKTKQTRILYQQIAVSLHL